MEKIAKFSKVSLDEFKKACESFYSNFPKEDANSLIEKLWNEIKLPKRATKGSAGYDFFSPMGLAIPPKKSVKIPTGIRVQIDDGWVLKLYPRSSLGFKYRLQLDNTVGIVDSDYFSSDNEGHIYAKITNDSNENMTVMISQGDGFMQGIFVQYGIVIDDETDRTRNGGFGSTNPNK